MIFKSLVAAVLFFSTQVFISQGHFQAFAGHKGPKAPPALAITGDEPAAPFTGISLSAPYSIGPGDSIMFTRYDFLTNGSSTRNLVSYGDGTIALGRMAATVPATGDRGTWYGCSNDDGATWPSLSKIEATRTGWGTITQIPDANGTCVSLAHDAAAFFLNANTDVDRCAGGWSGGNTPVLGFWPRVAAGNGADIHVLHADANPPTTVFYSHSPDGGATWDNTNVNVFTLPGNLVFADTYNLAAQGSNVAAVSAGYLLNLPGPTSGGDVILATSTDGGVTWSEQYAYDIDNNNLTEQDVPDGASAVGFDPAGNIHVVWSNFYTPGDGSTYYSVDAGIYHWSEATGAHEIILPLQDTLIVPPTTGREGNFASAPSIGFDDDGNIFVVYSQFINQKDINLVHYEHVYAAGSSDGGVTWTQGVDITPGAGFDAAFPSLAENVGDNLEVVYWSDNLAGNAIRGAHPEQDVAVMYLEVPKTLVLPDPNVFMDDFEAYTAGIPLVLQNNTDWDTWSSLPGSGEDPYVSDAYSYSGANTVVIASGNDLIRLHDQRTSGSWGISFQMYIPAGKQGYFNTMSGFTPNPFYWGMEVHFEPAGAGRLVSDVPVTSFTWLEDTWQLVEVIVDLDQDLAQFVLDGTVIHQWQWTTGASGGTGPLQLDANDFYGATANDEMYFDDYHFKADSLRTIVDPNVFMDDFEAYTAGVQLVSQNNTDWDTWSSLPGSGEDPFVSDAFAYSGSNSVVIASANDLVRYHDQRTTGSWGMSFQVYIPTGSAGYFNTMSGFTPNPFVWAMEVFFDAGGAGRLIQTGGATVPFTWLQDTWQLAEVIVDLDQDLAQFVLDGSVISQWQWTIGGGPLQLDVNDFYGATASDQMYFDDYLFMADTLRPTTAVGDPIAEIPVEYGLNQNYPNPFNPSTRIAYALPEQATVTLRIYNLLGQEVATLADKVQEAGFYEVVWNGRNGLGQTVGTGVYFYRFEARGTSGEVYSDLKKMLFLK